MTARLLSSAEDRFSPKVDMRNLCGCWPWVAAKKAPDGYGNFMWEPGLIIGAHVASWLLYRGPLPDGLHVLHRCDHKPCVRPDHLFLGTPQDNINDYLAKGHRVGAPPSIPDADVIELRLLRSQGWTLDKLRLRFGISLGHASVVARGLKRKASVSPSA